MFMCAVARPRYGSNGEVLFYGKIGIWPFIVEVPAKRNSRNRVAGTMETKCIESVNKQVVKDMIIKIFIPAIKAKWPESENKHIIIQQDNARPHIKNSDPDFKAEANKDEWNIELSCQAPNSPDLNVLDLGFFRAIRSLQQRTNAYKLDKLVVEVNNAFEKLEVIKLNYVFITLQACMIEVLKRKGGNDYPLPHMHKSKLAAAGLLPDYLTADLDLVRECITYLNNVGDASSIKNLVDAVKAHDDDINEPVGSITESVGSNAELVGNITEPPGCSNEPTSSLFIDLTEDQVLTNEPVEIVQ
ncbi:uncharacterized protein LOC141648797 [Silene latifolia]|uniref:uncharacterized protein LOC141648797 n=1 Tax=Silene latifolia TaxID=37657 RepID=UPI003D789D04